MSQTPVGIITDTTEPMPNWEALLLQGASEEDRRRAELDERRRAGNAHPKKMYYPKPRTVETIGIVYTYWISGGETVVADQRDLIVSDGAGWWHITWRSTDQFVPGRGMFAVGQVILRADGRKQFRPFESIGTDVPLDAAQGYVEGLPSTSY